MLRNTYHLVRAISANTDRWMMTNESDDKSRTSD